MAYLDNTSRVIIGITRTSVAKKLDESEYFILFPKDTSRHRAEIFKPYFQKYYYRKKELTSNPDEYLITSFAKIVYLKELDYPNKKTELFFKCINYYFTWTLQHLREYALGTRTEQRGIELGKLAFFILRVYNLPASEIIERKAQQRVSNQFFNITLSYNSSLNLKSPVYNEEIFYDLKQSIELIYEEIFSNSKEKFNINDDNFIIRVEK